MKKNKMRMAKIISTAAVLGTLLQPVSVWATALDNDVASVVNQTVNAGALTMQAPADITLPAITVDSAAQTIGYTSASEAVGGDIANKELQNWKVDDARGHKPSQVPGWSLTVTMTDFSDHLAEESVIALENITLSPNDKEVSGAANVADVNLGLEEPLTESGTAGVSVAKTVATAPALKGRGRFQGDLGFKMVVPSNTDAATYVSTATLTVS